jgi:beta-phosphoglucomutase-like phosphatase (HAD superfamily)
MSLKLVIFDMDGVLVDACDWHKDAFNQALEELCGYKISDEEHYSEFNGLPTKTKLAKLAEKGIVKEDKKLHKEINNLKQENTIRIIEESCAYDNSKVNLVSWLKLKGIKVACFTNSIRKTAELMLDKCGVLSELDLLVTNQDVKEPKPSPEGYLKVLKHFNISPQDAMIVEDSPKGIKAATAAGCKIMKVDNATQVYTENMRRFIHESFDSNGG